MAIDITELVSMAEAYGPKLSDIDGERFQQFAPSEFIKLDEYQSKKKLGSNPFGFIRKARMIPGGTQSHPRCGSDRCC